MSPSQALMGKNVAQATTVPTVPGANGDKPLPKPQAMKCAGWVKRKRSGGALLTLILTKMIESFVFERDRPTVCIQQTNAPLSCNRPSDTP